MPGPASSPSQNPCLSLPCHSCLPSGLPRTATVGIFPQRQAPHTDRHFRCCCCRHRHHLKKGREIQKRRRGNLHEYEVATAAEGVAISQCRHLPISRIAAALFAASAASQKSPTAYATLSPTSPGATASESPPLEVFIHRRLFHSAASSPLGFPSLRSFSTQSFILFGFGYKSR